MIWTVESDEDDGTGEGLTDNDDSDAAGATTN